MRKNNFFYAWFCLNIIILADNAFVLGCLDCVWGCLDGVSAGVSEGVWICIYTK